MTAQQYLLLIGRLTMLFIALIFYFAFKDIERAIFWLLLALNTSVVILRLRCLNND
jgi:Cu/Ag efflux pump CusA